MVIPTDVVVIAMLTEVLKIDLSEEAPQENVQLVTKLIESVRTNIASALEHEALDSPALDRLKTALNLIDKHLNEAWRALPDNTHIQTKPSLLQRLRKSKPPNNQTQQKRMAISNAQSIVGYLRDAVEKNDHTYA